MHAIVTVIWPVLASALTVVVQLDDAPPALPPPLPGALGEGAACERSLTASPSSPIACDVSASALLTRSLMRVLLIV